MYLDEYKNALVEQYGRSEERANELKQQMEGEIRDLMQNEIQSVYWRRNWTQGS